ncbi:segregation and condensation protein B [Tistrella bauzanensis]|uniref:Segregation and condensation protein B n=2 Tax=Tistrella bauzanensis TaxID=657419 RepID=A0ABQ1IAE2_9PROT|nr:segregation and condensation protein B [Tistrella bauzanensis]
MRVIEAVLFASPDPVPRARLAEYLPAGAPVDMLLQHLAADYAGRGIELVRRDDAWAFRTAPDLAAHLQARVIEPRRLGRAALEVLAIIAYHQPATRAEIEDIRGVALARGTLDLLVEAGFVRPRGRRQVVGRPLEWVTTPHFLDHFDLASLADLPGLDELKAAGLIGGARGIADYAAERDQPQLPLVLRSRGRLDGFTAGTDSGAAPDDGGKPG